MMEFWLFFLSCFWGPQNLLEPSKTTQLLDSWPLGMPQKTRPWISERFWRQAVPVFVQHCKCVQLLQRRNTPDRYENKKRPLKTSWSLLLGCKGQFLSSFKHAFKSWERPPSLKVRKSLKFFSWCQIVKKPNNFFIEEWILEANSDCYGKDGMFFASFAFCVISFEPIMI